MTETRNTRQDWLSVPRRREEERLDPHVYERGINGLTVEEATGRAFLISQVSRANLYRIAGILVADRRDEGAHHDRSLALVYVAALREAFLNELAIGEYVQTPFGTGEVRYISEDGENAAVRLDGGSRREAWLAVDQISRVSYPDTYGLRAS